MVGYLTGVGKSNDIKTEDFNSVSFLFEIKMDMTCNINFRCSTT